MAQVDYPAILEAAWAEHLAPRQSNAPTVISTFAGAGGSSLGYSMAGYRELLAVEWDDNAVATFELNFPDVPVYHGDICKLTVDECLRLAGLTGPRQLDVLDGSPPCQGFSTAGKRDMADDRNQLFREFVRLLRGLQPKVFVMENVSGMVKGKMKLIFADILRELKASGYVVSARLLNAMYFNVPQSRERMIFIGVREDLEIAPSHPKAEAKPVTVRQALVNCSFGRAPMLKDGRFKQHLDNLKPGQRHGEVYGSGYQKVKVDPGKVSPTISKSNMMGHAELYHWREPRSLSDTELLRLASFPDAYAIDGTYVEAVDRIGNSVPPLFMRSIARHIRATILTSQTPVLVTQ
jgi:DNA (cytosine-5)-methyltransferase 1